MKILDLLFVSIFNLFYLQTSPAGTVIYSNLPAPKQEKSLLKQQDADRAFPTECCLL
jgi:hypothetical protein